MTKTNTHEDKRARRIYLGLRFLGVDRERAALTCGFHLDRARCDGCGQIVSSWKNIYCIHCYQPTKTKTKTNQPKCNKCEQVVSTRKAKQCSKCYHKNRQHKTTPKREEAATRYKNGETAESIATALNISKERVCQYLRPLGLIRTAQETWALKQNSPTNPNAPVFQNHKIKWRSNIRKYRRFLFARDLVRNYQTGLSFTKLAKKYSIDHMTAWRIVSSRIKTRPPGPPGRPRKNLHPPR